MLLLLFASSSPPATIDPSAISSTAQVFTPEVDSHVDVGLISSTAQVFTPIVSGTGTVAPSLIASTAQVFTPELDNGVDSGFISSGEIVPSPTLSLTVAPLGIPSEASFNLGQTPIGPYGGDPFGGNLEPQIVVVAYSEQFILPTGITSEESFDSSGPLGPIGGGELGGGSEDYGNGIIIVLEVEPTGITSNEAFSTPDVNSIQSILPAFIASTAVVFSPELDLEVEPPNIGPGSQVFGPSLVLYIHCTGITSSEAFGNHVVVVEQFILPEFIDSTSVVYGPEFDFEVEPPNIGSGSQIFGPTLVLNVHVSGITTGEDFGTHVIVLVITPTGISTEEAFGLLSLLNTVWVEVDQNTVWVEVDQTITLVEVRQSISGVSPVQTIIVVELEQTEDTSSVDKTTVVDETLRIRATL